MNLRYALKALAAAVIPAFALIPTLALADIPSYAHPLDEGIHGRIMAIHGDELTLRDSHGNLDQVRMVHGTIIDPPGMRLAPGMSVVVHGRGDGPFFAASLIETPYRNDDAPPPSYASGYPPEYGYGTPYAYGPPYPYGGAPYWYGYGAPYGYWGGWPYGAGWYGPSVGLGFYFGGHYGYGRGGYYGGGRFRR